MRQLRVAHEVYNTLVQYERERRKAVADATRETDAEVARLEAEVEGLLSRLADLRAAIQAARAGGGDNARLAEAQAEARECRRLLGEAKGALRETKRVARQNPALRERLEAIKAEHHRRQLALYHEVVEVGKRLYWPSWNDTKAAVEQAAKKTKNGDLRFRRWTGEGSLYTQVQGKQPVCETATSRWVRIDPVPPEAHDPATPRGERRRLCRTRFYLRIGSTGPREDPVFAVFPMVYHRPLPEGAVICGARIVRRKNADREYWQAVVTVDLPDEAAQKSGPRVCALDIGWRDRRPGGSDEPPPLRVAAWYDGDRTGEVLVDPSVFERCAKADAIRSTRDRMLDDLRAWLCEARKDLPEHLAEALAGCGLWRAAGKFARLRGLLSSGDVPAEVRDRFLAWYHRDRHLWQYEHGMRLNAIRDRDNAYRIAAKRFAQEYDVLIVEATGTPQKERDPKAPAAMDLRPLIKEPDPEDAPPRDQQRERKENKAHHQRFIAAAGTFRRYLLEAAAKYGTRVVMVPCEQTTLECWVCGAKYEFDRWPLMHECESCGTTWDQDQNAARNLFARGAVAAKGPGPLEVQGKPRLPRWHKRHKAYREGGAG